MKNVPNLGFEAIKNLREAIDRDLVLSHDFCDTCAILFELLSGGSETIDSRQLVHNVATTRFDNEKWDQISETIISAIEIYCGQPITLETFSKILKGKNITVDIYKNVSSNTSALTRFFIILFSQK